MYTHIYIYIYTNIRGSLVNQPVEESNTRAFGRPCL